MILISLPNSTIAATLNSIQKGSITIPNGSSSITQSITSVDLSKSFLVFTIRIAENAPDNFQIGGRMTATDEITFDRWGANTACIIEWQVFEFSSGVFVQRGVYNSLPTGGTNITLGTSIDTSKSFVLLNIRKDGGNYNEDDGVTGNLTSGTNLFLDMDDNGGAVIQNTSWQVVEWTSSNVQKIISTLPNGSDSLAVTLASSVNKSKTMVVGSHQVAAGVKAADLSTTELLDDSTVIFTRVGTTGDLYFVCHVVEFTDNTDVVHGAIRMLASEDNVSTTICDVFSTSTAGIISPSNYGRPGNNCMTTDDHVGYAWATLNLTNSMTVNAQRASTGFAARFPFQVLEFSASTPSSCIDPEPGASTPRTNNGLGLCSGALPIKLLIFNAYQKDNDIQLEWSTGTEINNDYFTISKSKDGINWEEMIRVAGAGNSNQILHYNAVDRDSFYGTSYYRLKQTDFDGHFEYFPIIAINRTKKEIVSIYPNPTQNMITVAGNPSELKNIILINYLGQDITLSIQISEENSTKKQIDTSVLTPGVYFVKTATSVHKIYKR